MPKEQVEDYRLTGDFKTWAKQYKEMLSMANLLQGGIIGKMNEMFRQKHFLRSALDALQAHKAVMPARPERTLQQISEEPTPQAGKAVPRGEEYSMERSFQDVAARRRYLEEALGAE